MNEKIEHLRFERHQLGSAAQFAPIDIEHVIAKPEDHSCYSGVVRAAFLKKKTRSP
jgi:hypothetical protein